MSAELYKVKVANDDRVYTPKTYGMEGLVFKGFNVDDIFVAGSNGTYVRQPNMWELLKFHIFRSILNLVLALVGYYDSIPELWKQFSKFRRGIFDFKEFETSVYQFLGCGTSEKNPTAEKIPSHVATILTYFPHVQSPPPSVPETTTLADGTVLEPSPEEVEEVYAAIRSFENEKIAHAESESKRIVNEATELMCWCIERGVKTLTIYEGSGVLCEQEVDRIIDYARTKLALSGNALKNKKVNAKFHTHRRVVSFSNTWAETSNLSLDPFGIDETNGNDEDIVLEVFILEAVEPEKSLRDFIAFTSEEIANEHIKRDELSDEQLSSAFTSYTSGTSKCPDILVLFGSKASLNGYPGYALRNTLICHHRKYRSTSFKIQAFNQALNTYSIHNA